MHLHRLPMPAVEDRTGLGRRAVADRDDGRQGWAICSGELIPRLAAETVAFDTGSRERFQGERVDPSARCATGAVSFDITTQPGGKMVEHPLGQHAAGGVMGAEDQDMRRHSESLMIMNGAGDAASKSAVTRLA